MEPAFLRLTISKFTYDLQNDDAIKRVAMSLSIFVSIATGFLVTTTLIVGLRPIARAVGLVDTPNERKVHEGKIPLVGGLAIFVATPIAHLVSQQFSPGSIYPSELHSFYFAGAILIAAGLIDDYRELSPASRIVVQILAALVMIYGAGVVINDIGTMSIQGDIVSLGRIAVPFTLFATVGVINAVNMTDGLDGLAGSLSLIPILGFIAASAMFGNSTEVQLLAGLAASILAFLVFNVTVPGKRRALIFLGDSGSTFLGLVLAWFAIRLSQGEDRVITPAAALWFLIIPIYDAVCMASRRVMRKRPMFSADREHLHHVFLLAGFTVTETVITMAGLATIGVLIGLAGTKFGISDLVLAGSFLTFGLVYFWVILRAWAVMRFLRRSICRRREIADRRQHGERRRGDSSRYKGRERRSMKDRRVHGRRELDRSHLSKTGR